MITYQIDSVQFFPKSQICEVRGWAAGSEKQDIELKVIDESGKDIDQTFRRICSLDLSCRFRMKKTENTPLYFLRI